MLLLQVQLSALKSKEIHIKKENGEWCARTNIGGVADQRLFCVHVEMSKGWVPSVVYIEIFGENGSYELIEKSKGSGKEASMKASAAIARCK